MALLLTPEQRADIERQRREHPGRRIVIQLTPEQEQVRQQVREIELAGMEQNKTHARKVLAALREDSFSGQLSFERGQCSAIANITGEVGADTLRWTGSDMKPLGPCSDPLPQSIVVTMRRQ